VFVQLVTLYTEPDWIYTYQDKKTQLGTSPPPYAKETQHTPQIVLQCARKCSIKGLFYIELLISTVFFRELRGFCYL